MNVPELRTERLLLRGWRQEDLGAWAAVTADAEVMRWVGLEQPLDRDGAWRDMALRAGHWALRGFGIWAVAEREGGELVGRVGLQEPEGWPGVELAWLVTRPCWGRGYAPEAGRAALDWARIELGIDHVISLIADENARSARVAEKLGMTQEGRALVHAVHDVRVFGLDL